MGGNSVVTRSKRGRKKKIYLNLQTCEAIPKAWDLLDVSCGACVCVCACLLNVTRGFQSWYVISVRVRVILRKRRRRRRRRTKEEEDEGGERRI